MTELTEEQKYARKAEMLKKALAAADEMDKRDAVKAKSAKAEKQADISKQLADRSAEPEEFAGEP